jgi:hypothetical protein
VTARLVLLALVLAGCSASAEQPAPALPAGHGGGAEVDSAADASCVEAGSARELGEETFTGSSSVTLVEVLSAAGAAEQLTGTAYHGLPATHPVTACFFYDGRTYTSLLVDAEGRVELNPAAPQG